MRKRKPITAQVEVKLPSEAESITRFQRATYIGGSVRAEGCILNEVDGMLVVRLDDGSIIRRHPSNFEVEVR